MFTWRVMTRLVPPHPAADPEQARNATTAIRAMVSCSKGVGALASSLAERLQTTEIKIWFGKRY
jgi:hypothetical protein